MGRSNIGPPYRTDLLRPLKIVLLKLFKYKCSMSLKNKMPSHRIQCTNCQPTVYTSYILWKIMIVKVLLGWPHAKMSLETASKLTMAKYGKKKRLLFSLLLSPP